MGISFPVVGTLDTSTSDSEARAGFDGGFVQFKLGLLFGSGRPIKRKEEAPPASAESSEQPATPAPPPEEGSSES